MCQVTMVTIPSGMTAAAFQALNFDPETGEYTGSNVSHHRSVGDAVASFASLARHDSAAVADLYPVAVLTPENAIPFRHLSVDSDGDVVREVV